MKKYFKRLKTRKQFGVVKVSRRKYQAWKSSYENIKFTDWEQTNE